MIRRAWGAWRPVSRQPMAGLPGCPGSGIAGVRGLLSGSGVMMALVLETLERSEPTITHLCLRCGGSFPTELMVKNRKSRTGVEAQCSGCRQALRYRKRNPDGVAAVNHRIDQAPDPAPAARLRAELGRVRASGRPFSSAWPWALAVALRGLPPAEAASWRRTFTSTRLEWSRSYARSPWPSGRGMRLQRADAHPGA